jgi:hypothetical protein
MCTSRPSATALISMPGTSVSRAAAAASRAAREPAVVS